EDPERAVVLAGVLEKLDGSQADLNGLALLLHHEGVGFDRAARARPTEEVLEPFEHLRSGPGGDALPHLSQTSVPPTVMPSIRMVGSPTPTGTDWPSFPQVPTPSSRARSWPTRVTRVSASGPEPMRVAPLTGAVTRPFSIM